MEDINQSVPISYPLLTKEKHYTSLSPSKSLLLNLFTHEWLRTTIGWEDHSWQVFLNVGLCIGGRDLGKRKVGTIEFLYLLTLLV